MDPRFSFTYGYVQVVAHMPKGPNTWPALWLLPANHSTDLPEIDMVEIVGAQTNRPLVAFHPAVGPQQLLTAKTAYLSSGWHTFGLDWEPGSITWYIDKTAVFTTTVNVPSQPMYLLANLAITNAFRPLQLPISCTSSLSIRSVKVWQNPPA
jgi:beta-glucanase (GH16 family)